MASLFYSISVVGDCSGTGNGSISIIPNGGTPPYNVSWLTPNLGNDALVTSSSRTLLYSGTYSIQITDSSLPINNTLLVSVPLSSGVCAYVDNVQNTTCGLNNGSVTGASSSLYSQTTYFLYSGTNDFISSAITDSSFGVFNNLTAGTYYMVVLDVGGCTGRTNTFVVEPSTNLDYGLYVVPNSSCGNGLLGKIFVTGQTGTPPYNYIWSNGQTTSSITGLTSGLYSVNVTDSLGCTRISAATITDVGPVTIPLVTPVPPSCLTNNGSLTFYIEGGTPPYYYSASTGYFEISYSTSLTLTDLSSGPYSLLVTDAAYCTTTASALLATPEGMTSVNVNVTNPGCSNENGSMFVFLQGGTPPYTYTLIYPDGNNKSIQTTSQNNLFSFLGGGEYSLYVIDSVGCTFNQDYTLVSQNLYTVSASSIGARFGLANGSIIVTISSGGTGPYNYSLNNGQIDILNTYLSSVTFTNIASGQYNITVTDNNGCIQKTNEYVTDIPNVNFSLLPTMASTPSGGTITTLIMAGVPPFTFNWSPNIPNNPQTNMVENLTAGTYTLTLVDANSNYAERSVTVEGSTTISSYSTYTVSEETFNVNTSAKYSILKMFNEGYYDVTNGNSGCNLVSATFSAKLVVQPYGTEVIEPFYVTNSLVVPPSDNTWQDTIKSMILKVKGVGNVIIDELNNKLIIISDIDNQDIVNGTIAAINIKVYLLIDYEINCLT
jgi:hypothetical protein